jgi:glycosyltransferase involved in cell wall biosynthesis
MNYLLQRCFLQTIKFEPNGPKWEWFSYLYLIKNRFMAQPFVSCIMPTANRPQFLTYAIDYFLKQDYVESELIILDDGAEPSYSFIPDDPRIKYFYKDYIQLLGTKRNFCCEQATGEIIVHLDDDDWYATDWISKQVEALTLSGADLTGLSDINFLSMHQINHGN